MAKAAAMLSPFTNKAMEPMYFCAQTGTDAHFASLCLDASTMCSVEFEISILCCDVREKKNYTLASKDWDWTKRVKPGVESRSMISPRVTTFIRGTESMG